ncbi:MAG: hypothetical protein ACOC8H_00800 [bacterium]
MSDMCERIKISVEVDSGEYKRETIQEGPIGDVSVGWYIAMALDGLQMPRRCLILAEAIWELNEWGGELRRGAAEGELLEAACSLIEYWREKDAKWEAEDE